MTTLAQIKNGETMPAPIYAKNPYVLSANGESCILSAGTLDELRALSSYYDNCIVTVRLYDLYMNDNSLLDLHD